MPIFISSHLTELFKYYISKYILLNNEQKQTANLGQSLCQV